MSLQPDITDVTARCFKLLSDYERAENSIRASIAGVSDTTARQRRQVISRVNNVLKQLGFQRDAKVAGLIKLAYARGLHLVDPKLKVDDAGAMEIEIFKDSLADKLVVAESAAASNVRDVIKRTMLTSVAAQTHSGENLEKVVALIDRRGARWNLSAYAAVSIKTVAHEALTEGTITGMMQRGIDLIRVSRKLQVSPACLPYNGKVFSLSGKDGPILTKFPPFHQGCEHYLYPDPS